MKVAITGHTSGIGQGLFNYFESQGHEVQGFSRSNGYALPDNEQQVLDQITDADIFVNNALPISSQITLLKALWPLWMHSDKKIIVINSIASHLSYADPSLEGYQQQKKELHDLCNKFRYIANSKFSKCSIIGIHPGYVDTNIFSYTGNGQSPPQDLCMSVAQVVDIVDHVLNSPVTIDEIVFRR
jgi:NADP-dependent 3-hydroxy acid dehydrogenase YdfG